MAIKKKAAPKAKEPIKLRMKKLANGNQSLYLDYFNDGEREYEFLRLYLIPEHTPTDKAANTQTMTLANAIKAQKVVELQNTAHGFSVSSSRQKVNVMGYIKKFTESKKGNIDGYLIMSRHLEAYRGNKITFRDVDKKFCEGFIEHLSTTTNRNRDDDKPLSQTTQHHYLTLFNTILKRAIADDIIQQNPFDKIRDDCKPKKEKGKIVFLTIDEIRAMEQTPMPRPKIREAFLFSCFTGLRLSDVQGLTWANLQRDSNGNTYLNYKQQKTKKQEYLPIPNKAISFLPDRTDAADNDTIFKLPCRGYVNNYLRKWAFDAEVKKHIHFHVARHTYATLLLSKEVPIETVSKNLGHSEIRVTQIYAKVIPKAQIDAVNRVYIE